jgi:hypothetical protein
VPPDTRYPFVSWACILLGGERYELLLSFVSSESFTSYLWRDALIIGNIWLLCRYIKQHCLCADCIKMKPSFRAVLRGIRRATANTFRDSHNECLRRVWSFPQRYTNCRGLRYSPVSHSCPKKCVKRKPHYFDSSLTTCCALHGPSSGHYGKTTCCGLHGPSSGHYCKTACCGLHGPSSGHYCKTFKTRQKTVQL